MRAVETERKLSPDAALVALSRLSAFAHARHPSKVSSRVYALQDAHTAARVPAVTALDEALSLLAALGVREPAVEWCDRNSGCAGYWPCRESIELRERGRALMRERPAS